MRWRWRILRAVRNPLDDLIQDHLARRQNCPSHASENRLIEVRLVELRLVELRLSLAMSAS
jgi:hypothetical protein